MTDDEISVSEAFNMHWACRNLKPWLSVTSGECSQHVFTDGLE